MNKHAPETDGPTAAPKLDERIARGVERGILIKDEAPQPCRWENRIARGAAAGSVNNDEIIPFPAEFDMRQIIQHLAAGPQKKLIVARLNDGFVPSLFPYRAPEGEVLFIMLRLDGPPGADKVILPLRVEGYGGCFPVVKARAIAAPRPLYRLNQLVHRAEADVLLVEGEKTADAAQAILPELVVSTWQGGSAGVAHVDLSPLQGRRVTIWPDNDEVGKRAALKLAKAIAERFGTPARIVKVPASFPPKWDLADPFPEQAHGN